MKHSAVRLLLLLTALCALLSFSAAQNITGSIAGVVRDQTGAIVPNAQITVTNSDTGVLLRTLATNDSGAFTAPLLPVGHYVISATAPGFADTRLTAIDLHVSDQLKYDFVLKPAGTTTGITVEAEPIQVDTQNATAAGLINGTQIRELSLNNRNYEQLVSLQPGVSYGGGDQLFVGTTNPTGNGSTNVVSFSINGQRNASNNWTVDGADNVDRGSNLTLLTYPSVDAIAEFKTQRGLYNAEFGRNAGGQVNVVTKSGTNQFHGDAYEFFRNDVLNANNYFNKLATPIVPRSKLRYNDFGYTIGGPIKFHRDSNPKTFFFFSQEFRRIITYSTANGTVPTAAERTGVFASPICTAVTVAAGVPTCAAVGTTVAAIDPVAQAYLKDIINKIPLPNSPTDPHSLITPFRNLLNTRQELVRVDHNFGEKLALSFRFINDTIPTIEPGGLFTGAAVPGVATTSTNSPGRSYLGHFTYTLTPTFLIDGGYAFSKGAIISDPTGTLSTAVSPDIKVALPFTSTLTRVPSLTFRSGSSITGFGPYRDFNRNHNPFLNVTKVTGNHTLKFGIDYNHYEKTENAGGGNQGSFAFNNFGNPGGSINNFPQAFANFLTGYVNGFSQASQDLTPDIQTNQYGVYGQDQWKIRHNVTLTYGVRWSYFQQPYDANNLLTNFYPKAYNPAAAPVIDPLSGNILTPGDPLNGIIINNQNSPFGSRVAPSNKTNFAPRLGLAWDIFGDGKTSIRTGYGIVYDSSLFGIYEQNEFANPPFVNSISISKTSFANPGGGTVNVNTSPLSLHSTSTSDATPYTTQYSLDVQQQLPSNIILDVGYYGAKGTHLLGAADLNQPLPGAYLTQLSPAALAAFDSGNGNSNVLNTIRPYVGYGPITAIEPWFGSNYNSLQASLQKTFRGGSLVGIDYTWSHALTNALDDRSNPPQNTYCTRCEYGASALDRRNILSANFVYDLPWLHDQKGFTGHVLGGWELSGILAANSGLPLQIVDFNSSLDPLGQGVQLASSPVQLRPDLIGDPLAGSTHTFKQWFNPNAYASVPAGVIAVGNSRPGSVYGPGFVRLDTSLFKNFKFTESVSAQFRAEGFNVLNHTNFNGVDRGLGDTTFGQVTSTRDPRILQIALKLYF
ncbi:MAG: TonB-dependent receptor [Acidobacteriaceae bacterium]